MSDAPRDPRPLFTWLIAAALGAVVLAACLATSTSLAGGDTLWSVPLAHSVVHERDVDLNEFRDLVAHTDTHTQVLPGGERIYVFPWGPSIVSAPLAAGYDGWLHLRGSSLREYLSTHFGPETGTFPDAEIEIRFASVYVAASAVVLFFLLMRRTNERLLACAVSLVFVFGTSMFSTVSRALWSHTPSVLVVLVALYLFQVWDDRPERLVVAFAGGAALGLAYAVRPTNMVVLAVLAVAYFLRQRRAGLVALAGAALPIAAMVALNYAVLGKPLQSYYEPGRGRPGGTYLTGLAGNLISPARGLLVWSPFLLLAIPAAIRAVRRPARDRVLTVCVAVAVLQWLTIATLKPWWAGWSVGPRLFSDVLPFLMLLAADGWLILRARAPRRYLGPLVAAVALLVGFSLFTHVRAATHFSVQLWNPTPQDVDTHPDRLWDWSDPQFLR